MKNSFFKLNRLRILKSGNAVYDQNFHSGVNIIRGDNGSGKSTISDFIFYILGGEYDNWKSAARRCEEVQAEILTKNGILTIKREVGTKQTPAYVYYGGMEEASKSTLDGWERYPIRRTDNYESFSQILFRSVGIPEAKTENASNVTIHQILRLLYSDQKTPPSRLFRFESFDTKDIREAVGDLVCGLNVYELYDTQIKLKDLEKEFSQKSKEWTNLISALPNDDTLSTVESLNTRLENLNIERKNIFQEIEDVDANIDDVKTKQFLKEREVSKKSINQVKNNIFSLEGDIEKIFLELEDLYKYSNYLQDLIEKLPETSLTSDILGNIEFTHCPSCLAEIASQHKKDECIICKSKTDTDKDKSKYLQIRQDIEIQYRETSQLLDKKEITERELKKDLRAKKRQYEDELYEYRVNFEVSISPRENYLAQRNNRLGQIEKEIKYTSNLFETARELERVSGEKEAIQGKISKLKDRQQALELNGNKRKRIALTKASDITKEVLLLDFDRQDEFKKAQSIVLNFTDDVITVDGEMNFSDSSSVILKNTALLSLLLSALEDQYFYHPRFLLLDNIEDKGMEEKRSHNYQKIIVDALANKKQDHQLIFTTSMMKPELNVEGYTVGPYYTNENKTLMFSEKD